MMKSRINFIVLLTFLFFTRVQGQEVAVKTNLFYDALLNINAGIEVGLAPRWTMDVSGNFNDWNLSHDRKWKHWMIQPEARYWFCDRFGGSFLGFHLQGGQYNIGGLKNDWKFLGTDFSKLTDGRYQGWFVGGGIGYGYDWVLSRHWNLEAELGIGYNYTKYDRFNCAGCEKKTETGKDHHYFGVTKAALNLIYLF